jgi:hypothetical protein
VVKAPQAQQELLDQMAQLVAQEPLESKALLAVLGQQAPLGLRAFLEVKDQRVQREAQGPLVLLALLEINIQHFLPLH